jgi:hypothetical protein
MKFYGKVGYGAPVETAPGVNSVVITEVPYFGDVVRNSRVLREGDRVNDDLSVDNSISSVADAYAIQNIFAIRYVEWMGTLWVVSNVDIQSPRLLLRLGGVYNGPKPA